jgi:hypothetical protein
MRFKVYMAFVYSVKHLFLGRRRYVKERMSDKNVRRYTRLKRYRRLWFWHEERWNQRHNI